MAVCVCVGGGVPVSGTLIVCVCCVMCTVCKFIQTEVRYNMWTMYCNVLCVLKWKLTTFIALLVRI